MTTTKKKPAAKTPAKKPTAVRKTTVKATPKKQKIVEHRSFRPAQENTPFMTFQFTKQSVYWLVLSVLVLALGAWVMYLNVKIQSIYDQVEMNTQMYENYVIPAEKAATDALKAE